MTSIIIPKPFIGLLDQHRYYVYYGGRGSGKSHSIARYLICRAIDSPLKILCTRELQNSIMESVHSLLCDIIYKYDMDSFFEIKNASIECVNGSCFIFKGLAHNIESVKSTEGIDLCWIEEADKVSQASWDTLIPTIRKPNSSLLITFNPTHEDDPVYQMFVVKNQHDSVVQKVNYNDNPHFPEVLMNELLHLRETDYERYLHVWEGELRTVSDAQVFKGKYVVKSFSFANIENYYHGMDFGFAKDPAVVVRCFIKDENLYIDKEAYGHHIEMPDLSHLIKKVIARKSYKVLADCSRPETISYLRNYCSWNIHSADKWTGSVEDGIEYLRGFKQIIIHPDCPRTLEEFKRYSFKVDKKTNEILPVVIDEYNHCIDALRYAISNLIRRNITIYDTGVLK